MAKPEWRNTKHGEEDVCFPCPYKHVCCLFTGLLSEYTSGSFVHGVPGVGSILKLSWLNAFPSRVDLSPATGPLMAIAGSVFAVQHTLEIA